MKRIYWKPHKVTRRTLWTATAVALGCMWLVESLPRRATPQQIVDQRQAALLAARCLSALENESRRRGIVADPDLDPARTGLVGLPFSEITSKPGNLGAKRTAINPNLSALVVSMLYQAGVRRGDKVAIGWSGSFPGMNTAVAAAVSTMQLNSIAIGSATSSQYGANRVGWMWVDMERYLYDRGLIDVHSQAVSIGGAADRGIGLTERARERVREAIDRNQFVLLDTQSRAEAVERRMQLYHSTAAEQPIRAYINVGGGVASTGGQQSDHSFRPGLNLVVNRSGQVDCVMARFAKQEVPVIHLTELRQLAIRYGMAVAPTSVPPVDPSGWTPRSSYNRPLAGMMLALVLVTAGRGLRRPGTDSMDQGNSTGPPMAA